ncbi:MAG: RNA methyltransferase [Ignavibacteriales bacterium]|nr:RNA methyltransferase [Ignavibacteriales bacterium]
MKLERRKNKIVKVLAQRQPDLTLVMENIHDPHNVSAMLRSADAVGIHEVNLVYTKEKFPRIGSKSSSSANKWIQRRKFSSVQECYDTLRNEGFQILATRLDDSARQLYDFDLTKPTAFVFGNEHAGVSDDAARLADATLYIPMMGMIQSLNVSVACAVTIYEALRQRIQKNMYEDSRFEKSRMEELIHEWLRK